MADDCNINTIMARYEKTGLIEHVKEIQGAYGDFSEIQDYQSSLNQVIATRKMFDTLPSKIRGQFNNNPGTFLDFCEDPENFDEMVEMGLVLPAPAEVEDTPKAAPAATIKEPEKPATTAPEEAPAQ